jgi:hypothetical protein
MNIVIVGGVAIICILVAVILLRRQQRRSEAYEDISGSAGTEVHSGPGEHSGTEVPQPSRSTRQLVIDSYGNSAICDDLYTDLYKIQDRYLSTMSKANPEVDAAAELDRLASTSPLKCLPSEMKRILDRTPGTAGDIRAYVNCLPPAADFQRLAEFLVHEIKMSLSTAMNALSGDVTLAGAAPAAGTEGFLGAAASACGLAAACDAESIESLRRFVTPIQVDATAREYIRGILDEGLDAMKQIDDMNQSAGAGTIKYTPPQILH